MAINKKLIHFKLKTTFESELEQGNILDTSIVFIQDANLIWTHGTYYCLPNDEVIITDGIEPEDGQEIWIDTSEDSTLFAVEEAPKDDNQYARKNGAWAVIEASGGSSEHTLDLSPLFDSEGAPVSTVTDEFLAEVQKAYEERYSNAIYTFYGGKWVVPMQIIAEMEGYYQIAINFIFNEEEKPAVINHTFSIVEESKSVISTFAGAILDQSGQGTKALTDNGRYAEFATPIKVKNGGSGTVTKQLSPNTLYEFGECSSLTITLAEEIPNIYNEYMFEFTSGTTPTTLGLPSTVKWNGGNAPTIEASKSYIVAIVNNIAVIGGA